jgi:hypothetical protein
MARVSELLFDCYLTGRDLEFSEYASADQAPSNRTYTITRSLHRLWSSGSADGPFMQPARSARAADAVSRDRDWGLAKTL